MKWRDFFEDRRPCIIPKDPPKSMSTLLSRLKCSVVNSLMLVEISEMVSVIAERSVVSCMFMIVGMSVGDYGLVPTHTDTLRQVSEEDSS